MAVEVEDISSAAFTPSTLSGFALMNFECLSLLFFICTASTL